MSDYAIALVTGGMGIAGALLGVIFTYRLSLKAIDTQFQHLQAVSKLDAWHVAAQRLVDSFSEELAVLEGDDELTVTLDEYLRRAYLTKHRVAITTFRHFLDTDTCARFDKACQEYHSSAAATEHLIETGFPRQKAMFIEYMGHPFNTDPCQTAINKIRAVLAYAKQ